MHEMSIAQSLLDIVREEMGKNGVTRLIEVKIKSGEMNGVVEEALRTAFDALTRETPLEGARLEIETVALTLQCGSCGAVFRPGETDSLFFSSPCPECGEEFGHAVTAGKELNIEHIEAE
jgi:hydrogenase nickel incorporation protein HypA/HybF